MVIGALILSIGALVISLCCLYNATLSKWFPKLQLNFELDKLTRERAFHWRCI